MVGASGDIGVYYMTGHGAVYVVVGNTQVILRTGGHYKKIGQIDCTIGRNFEDVIKISKADALKVLNDE